MDGAHSGFVREHGKDGVCVRAFIQVARRARDRQRNGQDAQPPLQDLPAAVAIRFKACPGLRHSGKSVSLTPLNWPWARWADVCTFTQGTGLHGNTRPGT